MTSSTTATTGPGWLPVARELFEYQMVPWVGRDYAAWLRTSARPYPTDPHRLVLLPERIYNVFLQRGAGANVSVTEAELEAMDYPHLPDEHELRAAIEEQRRALLAGDESRVAELHERIEQLEVQVEAARRGLEHWQRADPAKLEERIAQELISGPPADVLVGIPAEAQRA